jgi:hypothetical protein
MRRSTISAFYAAVLLLGLALAPTARAQVGNAALSVRAVAAGDMPLPGVSVVARNTDTGRSRSGVTDPAGTALFRALPPGDWLISAVLEGFESSKESRVALRLGQTAHLRLILRPEVSDSIMVSGEAPLIDIFKTETSANIVPEQIERLPIPDRKFENLALLTPGVVRDRTFTLPVKLAPTVGASSSSQFSAYLVDGVDLVDNYIGLSRVKFSADAIREFRVLTGRFDAEIGGTTGGALSLVTRTGGNELRGSVFSFYRPDALRSQGALELAGEEYSRLHLGLTVGGPLARNRSHYFVAAEHLDENNIALVRPRGAFGNLAEDVDNPIVQTTALASLSLAFGEAATGTVKLMAESFLEDNYQVGGVTSEEAAWAVDRDNWNLIVGHTWVVGPDRLNELRAQWGTSELRFPGYSNAMGEWFSGGGTYRIGSHFLGHDDNLHERRVLEVSDTYHFRASSRHWLRAGLSWQYNDHYHRDRLFANGWMIYATDTRDLPVLYSWVQGTDSVAYSNHILGGFVQDDWRVNDRVTVSLGVRYDLETGGNNPDFEHPLVGERHRDTDNLQPRIGFTWDLAGDGRNVVRGGLGRYVGRFYMLARNRELYYNGHGGPVLRRSFGVPGFPLDPNDPENSGLHDAPIINLLGDENEAPEATQANLGLSHRLGDTGLVLEIEGLYSEGDHEAVRRDTNWGGNDNPVRLDPAYAEIETYTSDVASRYRALVASVGGTLRGGHLVTASMTLSEKENHVDEGLGRYMSDPADLEGEWGPSATDERYRLVFSGIFRLPWQLDLGATLEYGSGQRWTREFGYEYNGHPWRRDRPTEVGRNDREGPPFRQLNLRLAKTFALGTGRLEVILEGFNVLDTTNYDIASVDNRLYLSGPTLANPTREYVPNSELGSFSATRSPREIQIGLRWAY